MEVQSCVKFIRGFCALSLPDRIIEDTVERKIVERFVPLGVVVGIVPWNFPLMLTIFKLPAALLTGNTFILKPSPMSPYSGLKLAELACRFFPPGVFQALSGNDDLGPWLTGQEGIPLSFYLFCWLSYYGPGENCISGSNIDHNIRDRYDCLYGINCNGQEHPENCGIKASDFRDGRKRPSRCLPGR